jgi:Fic/DOC family
VVYVTRLLSGRPYQAYIPAHLFPAVLPEHVRLFAEVDACLEAGLDRDRFLQRAPYTIVHTGKQILSAEHIKCAASACQYALEVDTFDCKRLKRAHALLLGATKSEFRTGPGWVGAPHPSMAWHVGTPEEKIKGMMTTLMSTPHATYPVSLLACVRLFRILQIHPFADGNGRIARLAAIRCVHEAIGPAVGILELVDAIWDRAKCDIHSVSLSAQKQDDFSPIFEHIGRLIQAEAFKRSTGTNNSTTHYNHG